MNRIRALRLKRNLKQEELAKILNVSQSSLSGYENGKYEPDKETLVKLADCFNVSVDYILGYDKIKTKHGIKIPVLGYVRAGIPIEAVEEILDYEEIPQEMASRGEYFALSVKGDSMQPRIQEGDVVIVRKQSVVENGEIAVVLVNGNDATVKKFERHKDGISLIAFNPTYTPMFFTKREVDELPVEVIGKVVELRAKFK